MVKPKPRFTKPVGIRISERQSDALDSLAKKLECTRSYALRVALNKGLGLKSVMDINQY